MCLRLEARVARVRSLLRRILPRGTRVQTALGLFVPAPTTSARVLTVFDWENFLSVQISLQFLDFSVSFLFFSLLPSDFLLCLFLLLDLLTVDSPLLAFLLHSESSFLLHSLSLGFV